MTSQSASSAEFIGVYCDYHTKHTKFMNKMQFLSVAVYAGAVKGYFR
jgi:hypothetical protein